MLDVEGYTLVEMQSIDGAVRGMAEGRGMDIVVDDIVEVDNRALDVDLPFVGDMEADVGT